MKTPTILREALPYIRKFRGETVILKFSGKNIHHKNFENILCDISVMHEFGMKVVIVHGAGPQIEAALPTSSQKIDGVRVTTEEELSVISRILPEITQDLADRLREWKLKPVIFPKGAFVVQKKNFSDPSLHDHYTGEIEKIAAQTVSAALSDGMIPLFSSYITNEDGTHFNVNADEVAVKLAKNLSARKLVFFSDVQGILDQKKELISVIPLRKVSSLEENGIIHGGMIPKVEACRHAIEAGVKRCHIVSGALDGALLKEFFTPEGSGTMILEDPNMYEHIRKATKEDLPFIVRLVKQGIEEGSLRPRTREEVQKTLPHFFVFEMDEQIMGCVALSPRGERGEINALYILPKFRAQGMARMMIQNIKDIACDIGYTSVFAVTQTVNKLFLSEGFQNLSKTEVLKWRPDIPWNEENSAYSLQL